MEMEVSDNEVQAPKPLTGDGEPTLSAVPFFCRSHSRVAMDSLAMA